MMLLIFKTKLKQVRGLNYLNNIFKDFNRLDEYLRTISTSQVDISNFLHVEDNGETPNGEYPSAL